MGVVDRWRREMGKSLSERGNNDLELTRFMTSGGGCGGGAGWVSRSCQGPGKLTLSFIVRATRLVDR